MDTPSNQATIQKQKMMAELQQKQIFISLKNIARDAPILEWEPAILTRYCSDIISNFFEKDPENAPMSLPLHVITRSAAGNVMLTFKMIEDASQPMDQKHRPSSHHTSTILPNSGLQCSYRHID